MDPEKTKYVKVARKIRFYPGKQLKLQFGKYLGAYRFFYNKTISYINNNYQKRKEEIKLAIDLQYCCYFDENKNQCMNKTEFLELVFCDKHVDEKLNWDIPKSPIDLRDQLLKKVDDLTEEEKWQKEIPYDIKQNKRCICFIGWLFR